jgi:ribosomal protein L10
MLRGRPKVVRLIFEVLLPAVVIASLLAACGSSSKPSYCSKTSALKQSVKDLGGTNILKGGPSAVTTALQKVQSSAQAVVSSAKGDFPKETGAITSSIDALKKTAEQLAASPTKPALIARLPGEVSAVASSIQSFTTATSSKCS